MLDKEVEDAVALGRENQEFVVLGQSWCTHIRTDRSFMGVGIIEQETGLPISGGRFTCDFAASGGGVAATQLSVSALDFYEKNCLGCLHRSPGGRIPNLGTWAGERLAERARKEEAEAAAQARALEEAAARAEHRRFIAASLSASCQEAVALINRVDIDETDDEAGQSLLALARLDTGAFPVEIEQMLLSDARTVCSSVLLGALVELNFAKARDCAELRSLCVEAIRGGWATDEGCAYLSRYGTADDISDSLLAAIVAHVAPPMGILRGEPGDPAALVHYHSLAPETVEAKLAEMLRHGDPWARASAGASLRAILGNEPGAGARFVTPLLDALRHHKDGHDLLEAEHEVETAVAAVMRLEPDIVAEAVGARWHRATAQYKTRILSCYDNAIRHTSAELPADLARVILDQVTRSLSEPYSHTLDRHDDDYQGRATDVLKQVVKIAPAGLVSPDTLIGLLLMWLQNRQQLSEVQFAGPLAALEQMSLSTQLAHYIRDLRDAIVSVGNQSPGEFASACKEVLDGVDTSPDVRAEILRIIGQVATASASSLNVALPVIYSAMLGDEQLVRASGMEAAGALMHALPAESVPPLLAAAAAAGLSDPYLIVVDAAVEAIRDVPGDLIDRRETVESLLNIAWSLAPDRLRENVVGSAVRSARRLAGEDPEMLSAVCAVVLRITRRMPASSARKLLSGQRWLEIHGDWADATIHALRIDEDARFEHPDDYDRERLLERLGRRHLGPQQIDELVNVLQATGGRDRWRSLRAADVLGELGRPDLGAQALAAYRDTVPDTIEMREQRRFLELAEIAFGAETAIASADSDTRQEIVERLDRWHGGQ